MSNFVNDWVRCNVCFRNFDKEGGSLTSCGHFFCGRPECRLIYKPNEKIICPICKTECSCISLNQTLPNEVLQYFEDPEILVTRTLDVIRFQQQQKDLARQHYEKQERRIRELEEVIDEIRAENKKLKSEMKKKPLMSEIGDNEPKEDHGLVKDLLTKQITSSKRRFMNEDAFMIQTEVPQPETPSNSRISSQLHKAAVQSQHSQDSQPSKLFTPTLASRLQGLTGKKLYEKKPKE